jgi:aspartyl-tRNA(Asn)/glutamyl-tRNA(Gln) amidotransferase subunit A
MDTELTDLTLTEQAALLARGACSSRELVDAHLARISVLEPQLHAFVEVYRDAARKLADAADRSRAAGLPVARFHGLPIGIKDLFDIEGQVSTVGSRMWATRRATQTSAAVERLLAAGMIALGKLHMVEFAFGGWGTNALMGTPLNPWDLDRARVPGGSSSGTAVAVASGMVPAGLGSDTGGSVRVPAAFCGITALKVTYGRISLHGSATLSWTLDSVGPMARSVADCAALFDLLAGPDPRDPGTLLQPALENASPPLANLNGVRIALPPRSQLPGFMHPAVVESWQRAASLLEQQGATIVPLALPDGFFDLSLPASLIIAAEAFSVHRDWIDDPTQPINDVIRARVLNARRFSAADYAGALRAMAERRRAFGAWFRACDALLLPTVATPAPPLDTIDENSPLPNYLTRPVNYLGLCALALPSGLHEGLPLGVQLIGKPNAERELIEIGQLLEQALSLESRPSSVLSSTPTLKGRR